jgi:hypothetical protein
MLWWPQQVAWVGTWQQQACLCRAAKGQQAASGAASQGGDAAAIARAVWRLGAVHQPASLPQVCIVGWL